jgi:hypothetical protein
MDFLELYATIRLSLTNMIYDLEHYLRMPDFMKMGKRGSQRFAGECSGSDAPQLPVGPAKIRLPRQRRLNLAVGLWPLSIKCDHFLSRRSDS